MQDFIRQSNINLYRKRLSETTDESERRLIERLLAEEEMKAEAKPDQEDAS